MRSTVIVILLGSAAHAQIEDEPTPNAPVGNTTVAAGIPDATFRAVGSRPVIVRTRNGAELAGRILSVEAATVTLALADSGAVVTLDRADLVQLRLPPDPPPPPLVAAPPTTVAAVAEPPSSERHFALNLGIAPALDLDVDYGLFYGFANASLVFPAASAGQLAAFSLGAGINFRVAKHSRWKLELFAYVAPARLDFYDPGGSSSNWAVGFGVGVGLHYTMPSGFTFGFKVPILGYAGGDTGSGSGAGFATYYLASAMGLPIFNLGYRF